MSLKELTMENHRNAERAWFASRMFSGQITNPEYAIYLKQQFESYKALEDRFDNVDSNSGVSFPDDRIKRADNIYKDLVEMDLNGNDLPVLDTTSAYKKYILSCPDDLLYAHVYVRYLGDLKGGQMIAKRVPGKGLYYQFEEPDYLKNLLESNCAKMNYLLMNARNASLLPKKALRTLSLISNNI